MTRLDDFRQAATPLDRFLFATVGVDGNGNAVTVLSAFARLGLDPRKEATDLAKQAPATARLHLRDLLARLGDVAGAGSEASVQLLLDLLPQKASPHPKHGGASSLATYGFGLGEILAIIALILVVYSLYSGPGGSGG
jgi:hypothetical protein